MAFRILVIVLLFCLTSSCGPSEDDSPLPVTPKNNRRFGFHITETEQGDYDANFQIAKKAGMEVVPLTLVWNQVESNKDVYDFTWMNIVNQYYPVQGVALGLTVTPIYAVQKAVPQDLAGKAWNDPVMVERFASFLQVLKQKMPAASIAFLSIGNEVDLLLKTEEDWEQYRQFVEAARLQAKNLWGNNVLVGMECTWNGLTRESVAETKKANQNCDYIQVSYYPLQADFTMKDPEAFAPDMDKLLALYPNRHVIIEETGYATSTFCNGSEDKQKQYVQTLFRWWDQHADKVPFIGFLWLSDLSEAQARQFASDYGLPGVKPFEEYLRTTAFRTWDGKGTDKVGFVQIQAEARLRSW